jgi:arginase family enzyme
LFDGVSDPGFCPGTGTPEIGGLTSIQAIEVNFTNNKFIGLERVKYFER